MLYYSFRNYEEFQHIFGIQTHGNGAKSRKNALLLGFLKDRGLLRRSIETNDYSLLHITSMQELKSMLYNRIQASGALMKDAHELHLMGYRFYSPKFETDSMKGICEDGDMAMIRYINLAKEHEFKMRPGRMLKHIIDSCDFGKTLPKSIINWLCEEFTTSWQAHVMGTLPKNTLHVDDNFALIYDREHMKRDGEYDTDPQHSCMTSKGFHQFYKDSVNAKAAYLTNEEGLIIARCIIFMEVFDEGGKVWRYAERAYSYHVNLIYQQALYDALIKGGYIDCHKKVGAGCSESNSIVDIYGNSLSHEGFRIKCGLDWGEPLSYQDSFKWYSMANNEAYNYEPDCDYEALDTTNGQLEDDYDDDDNDDQNYDSYHDTYTYEEVCTVYFRGEGFTCAVDSMEHFRRFNSEWYHKDDLVKCPHCGALMLTPEYYDDYDNFCSELTGDTYCSEECLGIAEEKYKAKMTEPVAICA